MSASATQGGRNEKNLKTTRMWANANVVVALPNIGGVLCSTPQSLADTHYLTAV